jgi:formylglycine-generating enzyme required for sulfatase activity
MRLFPRQGLASSWQSAATDEDGVPGVILTRLDMPQSISDVSIFGISRDDAEEYCAWLAKQTTLKVRLPSKLEWQSAATGGDVLRVYPWGEVFDRSFTAGLMTPDGKKRDAAIAVGTTPMDIGPFGHLDLGGNVREWVADRTNPKTTHGAEVVGGSWAADRPQDFSTTAVISAQPFFTNPSIGFRILVELP